jgi:hypothetical protein
MKKQTSSTVTLETTKAQLEMQTRISDEIEAVKSRLASPRIQGIPALRMASGAAIAKHKSFVEYHGQIDGGSVPDARKPEMERLKNEATKAKEEFSNAMAEKEALETTIETLQAQHQEVSVSVDLGVIRQQQAEIDATNEKAGELAAAIAKQQEKLSAMRELFEQLVTMEGFGPNELTIIKQNLLAEKVTGKDVDARLEEVHRQLTELDEKRKEAVETIEEEAQALTGLERMIGETERHGRYLEADQKMMVLQFLKNESETAKADYDATVKHLIGAYCKLRSLDSLIVQTSDNKEASFLAAKDFVLKIPAIGPNTGADELLFDAGTFGKFGECLQQERERLFNLGVQC